METCHILTKISQTAFTTFGASGMKIVKKAIVKTHELST